mmetsp:Transcript_6075/g.8412  ORF Transcript_6075/g.8412 Transcript_6075/m.8412 type:complete len:115 (-) Transcript_6075:556-900(-)
MLSGTPFLLAAWGTIALKVQQNPHVLFTNNQWRIAFQQGFFAATVIKGSNGKGGSGLTSKMPNNRLALKTFTFQEKAGLQLEFLLVLCWDSWHLGSACPSLLHATIADLSLVAV